MRSGDVLVQIDLGRIRRNTEEIARKCGVEIIAVIKCDAYGFGAREVSHSVGDLVSGWCVFGLREAQEAELWQRTRKETICLGPSFGASAENFLAAGAHPAVWSVDEAKRLRATKPILSVDTGMRRFACPAELAPQVIAAGDICEAFTHATRVEHARLLKGLAGESVSRLHAAATALLDEPEARLSAVRPGLAIYRGAARVCARLVEVHSGGKPAGYSGFVAERFGIILCGYSNGLRRGYCAIGGRRREILEIGMQTAFVEIGPNDRLGDEVVLLGDGVTESDAAARWQTSEQLVLHTFTGMGVRTYR